MGVRRRFVGCFLLVMLVLGVALPLAAEVPPPAPAVEEKLKQQVIAMLSGIEHFPSAEKWRELPDDALKILKWVVIDTNQWPIRRARAVTALGYFKRDDTMAFLASVLKLNDRIAPMLKRKAMYALAKGWGDAAIELIQPQLADSDFFVREAAVHSLAAIATPKAFDVLTVHREKEAEPAIRKTIDQALKKAKAK